LGARLRARREELRMTQTELSKKSGVSRTTISALEQDEERIVMTKTLYKLAEALDTTVDQLFFAGSV